nr:unnamed protein product [Callosobruchus analis]
MNNNGKTNCPLCDKLFMYSEIEQHVNKCLFLNTTSDEAPKRKRPPSPSCNPTSPILKKGFSKREHSISNTSTKTTNLFRNHSESKNATSSSKPNTELTNTDKIIDHSFVVPLAKQVQPKTLDDFIGQNKILGKDTVLRNLLEQGDIPNMILWGPPGCGKTSLSAVICDICKRNPTKYKFSTLCAVSAGVKEVQQLISIAKNDLKFGRRTVLFMDEIHRFNKKQQDTFLLSVEKGELILIGATTENPSFILNSALLSRCRVIVMNKLECGELYDILERAARALNLNIVGASSDVPNSIEQEALKWLADVSDGDARIALTNLQLVVQDSHSKKKSISMKDIQEGIKKSHMLYDRNGEEHYNIISAMHKSIRQSDDNAALYWTTRMIVSGEDPRFIARRLVRAASEDIGNADPAALQLAVSTMEGCQLLGMPECDVLLAQCAIYLARAPKSREADSALAKAKATIQSWKGPQPAVPMHLRNAPTRLMKDLGYGKVEKGGTYCCMPPELREVKFF